MEKISRDKYKEYAKTGINEVRLIEDYAIIDVSTDDITNYLLFDQEVNSFYKLSMEETYNLLSMYHGEKVSQQFIARTINELIEITNKIQNNVNNNTVLTVYLKPYRYRCISRGKRTCDDEKDDIFEHEGLYNDYDNSKILNILSKIWFEIVAEDNEGNEKHVGYITGYYINMNKFKEIISFDFDSTFIEFNENSHLTTELFDYLFVSQMGELKYDYYFMNSIHFDDEFTSNDVEKAAINLIPNAFYEIYRYNVKTIIYSIERTELSDETVEENYDNELKYERHIRNFLEIGFEYYVDNEEYCNEEDLKDSNDIEFYAEEVVVDDIIDLDYESVNKPIYMYKSF